VRGSRKGQEGENEQGDEAHADIGGCWRVMKLRTLHRHGFSDNACLRGIQDAT
jgi:hypothetical protein